MAWKSDVEVVPTSIEDIPGIVAGARRTFESGVTRPLEWRLKQLKAMKRLLLENKDEITKAIQADLRRPE